MQYFSQRDPRWYIVKLGNSTTSTVGEYGCKLCCLSMLYSVKKPKTNPEEVNKILKKEGAFFGKNGDLIDDSIAAKALKLEYLGKEYDKTAMPRWTPTIKEVDMSPSVGKQQHFVVRVISPINGKRYIVDPWSGTAQPINKYQFVSYRLFKV